MGSKSVTSRLEAAKKEYKRLRRETELAEERDRRRVEIIPKVENLLKVYPTLPTAAEKNRMLKEVLEKIVYIKDKNGQFHGVSAADFQVTLYPRLHDADGK